MQLQTDNAIPSIKQQSSTMSSSSTTKVEHKAVYDLGRKELKNRTEIKLDSGLKVGCRCVWVGGWVPPLLPPLLHP